MKQRANLFFVLLCLSLYSVTSAASPFTFKAQASGDQEVPSVITSTRGKITLHFDRALSKIDFDLIVKDGVLITQAHLHCARAGENGPVVAFLFNVAPVPGPGGIDVDGLLASDTLTNDSIIPGPCESFNISNIASLFAAMREGLIYLNVHSEGNPPGEVRGQIFPR